MIALTQCFSNDNAVRQRQYHVLLTSRGNKLINNLQDTSITGDVTLVGIIPYGLTLYVLYWARLALH
jgi:hypothetical protein